MEMLRFLLSVSLCLAVRATNPYTGRSTIETREYWLNYGRDTIASAKARQPNIAVAKNVILFLGDGMGVSTVTAARILKGQMNGQPGEEEALSFEKFPYVALSKTYNQDSQTPDSAGTATAFLCGIKTNIGVIGLDARARRSNCSSAMGTEVSSVLEQSITAGKSVGLVTTTRITHATPAGAYANIPERDWESDYDMRNAGDCGIKDIALQLVEDTKEIQVIFGGGRSKFTLNGTNDPEHGLETRGRLTTDLIKLWQENQQNMSRTYKYMWNKTEFDNIDIQNTDSVLGLFENSHMAYEADRDHTKEPSIAEMTDKAIRILSKNEKGFFLLVEGGRIDHAHHETNAYRSLMDTLAFADAVQAAVSLTSESDTLIVTSADHSHVFTIGGYPSRGNPILGKTDADGSVEMASDNKPFTTLLYTNGPGSYAIDGNFTRPNISQVNTSALDYKQQAAVPLSSETHAGEDVAIYARGPMSHLFHGVHEQNYIAHVMAYASCVGMYSDQKDCAYKDVEDTSSVGAPRLALLAQILPFALGYLSWMRLI